MIHRMAANDAVVTDYGAWVTIISMVLFSHGLPSTKWLNAHRGLKGNKSATIDFPTG